MIGMSEWSTQFFDGGKDLETERIGKNRRL